MIPLTGGPQVATFTETEIRRWVPGLGEEGELVFNGDRFQFGEKTQSRRWMEMTMPLTCTREMVKMVNFMLHVVYHNFKQ